jgi:hypothetical protein
MHHHAPLGTNQKTPTNAIEATLYNGSFGEPSVSIQYFFIPESS